MRTTSTNVEALRERLAGLRAKLATALAERKARMKELAALARAERAALRKELHEMRARALGELRDNMRAARSAAKVARLARLAQVKHTYDSAIAAARAAIAVEEKHQADERRMAEQEARQQRAIETEHAKRVAGGTAVRAASILGHFGPLFESRALPVQPAAGESKTEAVLRHVERNPHHAHAVLEPKAEQAIAKMREEIDRTKDALRKLPKPGPANRTTPAAAGEDLSGTPAFVTAVAKFRQKAERELNATRMRIAPSTSPLMLTIEPGKRYLRVVKNEGKARNVYAFVDTTNGDVLNAESWKKPKNRRGSIYDGEARR